MLFVIVGVVMVVMFIGGYGPIGEWAWATHWWALALPFVLASAWWYVSDATGRTQRKQMDKMDAKRAARRQKNIDALGRDTSKPRSSR